MIRDFAIVATAYGVKVRRVKKSRSCGHSFPCS